MPVAIVANKDLNIKPLQLVGIMAIFQLVIVFLTEPMLFTHEVLLLFAVIRL